MNLIRRKRKYLFLALFVAIFAANCRTVNLDKGEPLKESSLSFIVRELNQKSVYEGKRIQIVGYFDTRWTQRGKEVSLLLEQEQGNYDSMITIVKLNEGQRSNEISLGKTGESELVGANQVRGSRLSRDEFVAENMRVYDNEGVPRLITEKFGVSGTVEYMKDFWGNPKQFQDGFGNPHFSWELKDIRIDVEGK